MYFPDLPQRKPPTKAELERSDNKRRAIGVYKDIERIDTVLKGNVYGQIRELHISLDGIYGSVIKEWGMSMYCHVKGIGFSYELLDADMMRHNLETMKGKLQGYMRQLDPYAEHYIAPAPEQETPICSARPNMYDIITRKEIDIAHEYERIWQMFNLAEAGNSATPLCRSIEGGMQFFPMPFRHRAVTLNDFDKTFGFSFPRPPASVTEDELVSYCEYVITLCDHLWEYADDVLEDDTELLRDDLYKTVESCMYEMGYEAVKRDFITIYVKKEPEVEVAAAVVDEAIAFDVKAYSHARTKGDLARKKTILLYLANDFEPRRRILKANNLIGLEDTLSQMFNKFVRHNNADNAYIRTLSPDELEGYYDDIYQLWLTAILEIDSIDRRRRAKEVLGKINAPQT